jgi:carboxylesterase type B
LLTFSLVFAQLGFLPPSSGPTSNLGLRDVIAALQFTNQLATAAGISSDRITIAGQSSGATLIRAILAAPSTRKLFGKAFLASDASNYGFSKPATVNRLRNAFFGPLVNCTKTQTQCLRSLPLSDILSAQTEIIGQAATVDPATAGPVPLRPEFDGSLITSTTTTTFPPTGFLKPLLVTDVTHEGGPFIFASGIPADLPPDAFSSILPSILPDSRAEAVIGSRFYNVSSPSFSASARASNADVVRLALANVVGDLGFRCPNWVLARSWAKQGGRVYTGSFVSGGLHPSNAEIDFCVQGGVCHQASRPITSFVAAGF